MAANKIENLHDIKHIAIIADGNGRWAKKRFMPRSYGHKAGAENIRKTCITASESGLEYISFYVFSTENFKREQAEVDYIFELVSYYFNKYFEEMKRKKIRLLFSGEKDNLPEEVTKIIEKAESAVLKDYKMTAILCLNYGGRREIASACAAIAEEYARDRNKFDLDDHKALENAISKRLYLPEVPDPDLIIRTAGEMRLSNFWLWQAAYAEFYSSKLYWPEFTADELQRAIDDYGRRTRKFGDVPSEKQ